MTNVVREAVIPPPLKRMLKFGMKGEDVKYVQELLQKEGYFSGTPLGNFFGLTKDAVMYFQNTHIDENGEFLEPDGKVGKMTWWALHNANGSAQRNFIPTDKVEQETISPILTSPRDKVLAKCVAMHKQGIREIPDGSNYGDGVTPIVNACGFKYGIYWCLAAASYAFKEALDEKPLGAMHVSCALFWNEAKKRGLAYRKYSRRPTPGDIAIYNYAGGVNSKGLLSGPGHALIVASVSADGEQFNGFEGNVGNRYKFSLRQTAEKTLVGFVNPYGDYGYEPYFKPQITQAPLVTLSYQQSR